MIATMRPAGSPHGSVPANVRALSIAALPPAVSEAMQHRHRECSCGNSRADGFDADIAEAIGCKRARDRRTMDLPQPLEPMSAVN